MPIYHPRMLVGLSLPTVGSAQERAQQVKGDLLYDIIVRPMVARLVSNNHDEADELELTLSYDVAGIDPRFTKDAHVTFWLGDAADDGTFTPSMDNLRFIGIARTVDRDMGPNGRIVRIRALDYTTLFLAMKDYPATEVPDFSQTLQSAWERICDNTGYWDLSTGTAKVVSTVQALKKSLFLVGVPDSLTLGQAMPARIAKLGKLHVHARADAWAVWKTAVESLGLVTYIRGDRCFVTTSSGFYTSDDPPRFVNGRNVVEISESRDAGSLGGKGMCLRSFNPLSGQTLEALYPPPSHRPSRKRVGAAANGSSAAIISQDYEFQECPFPCADQATLQVMCQRAWEERSRQELRGHIQIVDMFVDTVFGESCDVLNIQAGDVINVEIDRKSLGMLMRLPTIAQRVSFLKEWGYTAQMAQYIADNLDAIVRMPPQFVVKSVETSYEQPSGAGGSLSYETRIEFYNQIHLDGSALVAGSGERPPMRDQTDAVDPSEKTRNDRSARKDKP